MVIRISVSNSQRLQGGRSVKFQMFFILSAQILTVFSIIFMIIDYFLKDTLSPEIDFCVYELYFNNFVLILFGKSIMFYGFFVCLMFTLV